MYAFKIACCALIFILGVRFPPGFSIANIIYIMAKRTGLANIQFLWAKFGIVCPTRHLLGDRCGEREGRGAIRN